MERRRDRKGERRPNGAVRSGGNVPVQRAVVGEGSNHSQVANPAGFTLIELLVVIAVIAVLLAILLPVARRVRNQARAVVCCAHVKQGGTVLALYGEDNDGRFPRGDWHSAAISLLRGMVAGPRGDPNKSMGYRAVRTEGIARCPMTAKRNNDGQPFSLSENGEVWLEGRKGATFVPWEITRPDPPLRMSYGLNGLIFDAILFEGSRAMLGSVYRPYVDVLSLKGRGNIPLLFDSPEYSAWLINERLRPPREESSPFEAPCINRHNATINVLFLDWSVRRIGLKGLWTLKWRLLFDTAGPWTKAGGVRPEDWPEWMRGFKDY